MANGNGANGDETGSKDRATVALVDAKVDVIKALVEGHTEIVATKLDAIKEKIAPLSNIPERVATLESDSSDHERRITTIEARNKGDREWRRINLPALVFSGAVAIAAIIGAVTQIH